MVIERVAFGYMVRRPFLGCRYAACRKLAVAIIKDLSATRMEYVVCPQHAEELMSRMERIEERISLEVHVYSKASRQELEAMPTLLKYCPMLGGA